MDEASPKAARDTCECILKLQSAISVDPEGRVLAFPSHSNFFLTSPHSGPTVESRPSSELLRIPSQSPTPSEPASPVRLFRLPVEDEDDEALLSGIANQHHDGDDSDTFFNSATERQHRENLLQALHDGKQLLVTSTVRTTPSMFLLVGRIGDLK